MELFDINELKIDYECIHCHTVFDMKLSLKSAQCPKCGTIYLTSVTNESLSFQSNFVDEDENGK